MLKKVLKPFLLLPFVALFTGAWTFELIDKPGSEHLVEGLQARDVENRAAAITAFEKAKESAIDHQTKARAMTQIATLYLSEEPVSPAKAREAIRLLEQAEQLGYFRAKLLLGEVYQHGKGINSDYAKAYTYFSQVKDRYPEAYISMAELTSEPDKARDYIVIAEGRLAKEVNPSQESTLRLARHFRDGTSVVPNPELAQYWYGRAVQMDSVSAMMELATFWQERQHEPEGDIIDLWKRASQLGNDRASLELGFAYATGRAVPRDKVMSEQYFARAVEMKPANAYRIARWYEERAVVNPSYQTVAFNWYQVAAVTGHPDAIIRQARAYWGGEQVPMDKERARELYYLAAQHGSDKAMPELAQREMREEMRHKKHLASLAAKEQKRAEKRRYLARKRAGGMAFWMPLAKQGDVEAMLRVGEAYIQGNGVPQDSAKGLEWMKKSAARGGGEAMYVLAQMYSAGLGVPMDLAKAYEWYEKSAKAGYAAGQYQLGLGYARGIGVSENHEKARKWLNKASKNGYSQANEILNTLTGPQS